MTLKEWMQRHPRVTKQALADALGTSVEVLYQYSGGHKRVGGPRATQIEHATSALTPGLIVSRADLRPDIFK